MPLSETTLLDGKSAIVTGGGGGIGRGISEAFAAHGARVIVAEKDPQRAAETAAAIRATGGAAVAVVADVQQQDEVDRVVATALDHGTIDILVNNVGDFLRQSGHFHDTDEQDWQAMYAVNLEHVFRMTKAVVPHMIDAGHGGCIITMSTVEAFRGIPTEPVYAAFKAGVAHFTKSLALDISAYGIRVNDIAADVTRSLQLPYDQWLTPEQRAAASQWVPLARLGEPQDAAGAAVFLASELSGFVTGTTVHVDGGTRAAGGWYRSNHRPTGWTNRPHDP